LGLRAAHSAHARDDLVKSSCCFTDRLQMSDNLDFGGQGGRNTHKYILEEVVEEQTPH
jgi:hypothetical protein